MNILSYT